MATWATTVPARARDEDLPHRLRVAMAIAAAVVLLVGLGWYGWDYYILDVEHRVEHPMHRILRPSGTVGLRLGMLGVALFLVIFIYPLRKRWRWLASIGKTKHWLDFHSIIGITAPILITYHAAFKTAGLAGWAYWIMVVVALSGFIGRYLYTQIPRTLQATELTVGELDAENAAISEVLSQQDVFEPGQFQALLDVPSSQDVRRMPLLSVLWTLTLLDLRRPFLVSALRRQVLTASEKLLTLGGLFASGHRDLELIISNARRQAGLRTKLAFLDRIRQMFHLWHVIHRPFSISFAALILVHIGVVVTMGYF
jgi:hypothetical protein